jgi:chromosome segregation ATPase
MTDSGRIDVGQLAEATRAAKDDFRLLDDQDLSNLRSAIDDAQQRMQALQEETVAAKDRIAELNAEIAREKGDTATADALDLQLEKQQKLAEVENSLAQARLENNRELIALYETQRSRLQELYDLKSRNLEKEQQQTKTETTSTTATSSSGGTTSSAAPSKTYQLNLVGDSGQTLTATTNTDPTAFLDALTAAKKRSLA